MRVLGLMSGTSADGVDAVLVELHGPCRRPRWRLLASVEQPYPQALRQRLIAVGQGDPLSTAELLDLSEAVTEQQALQNSDLICTALQLINFWQDLSVDIPRGRFYLPQADCDRHGVTMAELLARQVTQSTTNLIAEQSAAARASMQKGSELVHRVPGRAGWELRLVVQGGLRILDRIEALEFATLQTRPTLRRRDLALMAWRALWM